MRLISICPSNTELVEYLQLTDCLIAIDDFSDWPAKVNSLPRLGPDLSIDMDKLEKFRPDLVIASLSVPGMERNVEELQKRNIPHIVLNPNSLEDIANDLLILGKATDSLAKAQEIVIKYNKCIQTYAEIAATIQEKPTLYWEWWPKPVFTPGKSNWLTVVSQLAGGRNIFEDVELASVQTDWEDVKRRSPDYICMAWVGINLKKVNPELVKKRPGWDMMSAIINNQIHVLEEPLYCRPSPRLLLGLKKLAYLLHPTLFPKDDGQDPLM